MCIRDRVCAHNYNFPENLHRLMRTVETGVAQPFRWHGTVSPKRWLGINTVIVAIQGWLEEKTATSLSRTYGLKQKDLSLLLSCMGSEQSHIKRAMLKRLLWNLIDNAVHHTGLGIIGDCEEVARKDIEYRDFTEAYRWDDRTYYFELLYTDKPVRDLEEEIQGYGQSGVAFASYIRLPTGPFCQQKILRCQQLALYRVARKWTDPTARPPGGIPRSHYETHFQTYSDAVSRWYEGQGLPKATDHPDMYEKVFGLLGKPTECKRAVIDCLVFRSKPAQDLQEAAFHWLKEHTLKAKKG